MGCGWMLNRIEILGSGPPPLRSLYIFIHVYNTERHMTSPYMNPT
jgi:hypothetical protein